MEKEIFVEDEKRVHVEGFFDLAHDGKEFVTRLVEIDKVPLASEEG
jgi:hypothetical protein